VTLARQPDLTVGLSCSLSSIKLNQNHTYPYRGLSKYSSSRKAREVHMGTVELLIEQGLRPIEAAKAIELLATINERAKEPVTIGDAKITHYDYESIDRAAWRFLQSVDSGSYIYEEAIKGAIVLLYKLNNAGATYSVAIIRG
jgi:hypothetical protein